MPRRTIYLVSICMLLAALPAIAQEEPGTIVRVVGWKVKAEMENEFEQGLKRHNDFHRQRNDSRAHVTYQIISGENTGTYLRIAPGRQWTDFDAEAEWAEADDADSATNVDPYIESAEPRYYEYMPDVSRPSRIGPSAMAEVLFLYLYRRHQGEFNYVLRKVAEGAQKADWSLRYEWYKLVNGGEHPTYVLVLPREKWADFKDPEMGFSQMLQKAFGRHDAETILEKFGKAVKRERSEIVLRRADLSYTPASP